MTEPVTARVGNRIQWQNDFDDPAMREEALLFEWFTDVVLVTQENNTIRIQPYHIDEFIKNLRAVQRELKKPK